MASTSWYWTLIQIKPSGGYTTEESDSIRSFFRRQFSEFTNQAVLEMSRDKFVQRQLIALLRDTSQKSTIRLSAEGCLRCYISHQVLQVCIDLYAKFGSQHGFMLDDLLGIVLDDIDLTRPISYNSQHNFYQPFSAQILKTFDPGASSLSTWSSMLARQHNDLNYFLLEHGVFLQSDWAILNEKEPEELRRILSNTFGLPIAEIERACLLLSSYHQVYRNYRRKHRMRNRCTPPTEEQLSAIKQIAALVLSLEEVTEQLLTIAKYLRQYHVAIQTGVLPGIPINYPDGDVSYDNKRPIEDRLGECDEQEEQFRLIQCYRQQLIISLDQAIEQAVHQRQTYLRRRRPEKAEKYIAILKSYCCEKKAMADIALEVGLKGQYEVTRLLKIDDLLANIRRYTLGQLKNSILEFAQEYVQPDRLQKLDQKIEDALVEILSQILKKPRSNLSADNTSSDLFIRRLCHVIHQLE